jgi:hypothetical protein
MSLMAKALTSDQIDEFIARGFVRLRAAFPRSVAYDCVRLVWGKIGARADAPETWTQPVIRHPAWDAEPFDRAVNTPRLHTAFDQLVGRGRWRPRKHPGLFVIRFPSTGDPGDAGWHIDGSFDVGGEWWVNLHSRGRALLMLFLFTDVGPDDVPTRILVGSHLDVPPVLQPVGDEGTHFEHVLTMIPHVHEREIALATGEAGDVYLCHPFLVHAASWPHLGASPRFMAQPELPPTAPLNPDRADGDYSPVETAVRHGLGLGR